jgi:ADP-heptose:LPS heptosyltransferase
MKPVRSLLAIDASPFGQSLALLPSIRAIRSAHERSRIAAAASTGTCELISAFRLADETIDLGTITEGFGGAATRFFRLMKGRDQFDMVLDFWPRPETQLASLVGLRAQVLTPARLPKLLDQLFSRGRVSFERHLAECQTILHQLGLRPTQLHIGIEPPQEENHRFEQAAARCEPRLGPLAVFYASDAAAKCFDELAARLHNFGARVAAVDPPHTDAFTGQIAFRPALKLARPRAMEVLAAIARASLLITDDSGIAQLAAELHTPAILIGEEHTSAAVGFSCQDPIDEIFQAACQLLQRSRTPSLFER